MGVKIQFDNGKTVEFDGTPSDDDIDEAYQATGGKAAKLESQIGKVGDFAGGLLETLTTGAADMAGGLGAAVGGSVKGMLDPNSTASQGMNEALGHYSEGMGKLLAPRTKTGKYIADQIGKVVEGVKSDAAAYAESPSSGRPGADTLKRALGAGYSVLPEAAMILPMMPRRGGAPVVKSRGANVEAALADLNNVDRPGPDVNLNEGPGTGGQPLYADQRGVVSPQLPDAGMQAGKARQQGVEEVSSGAGRENIPPSAGENPIYVDPQGQAFRGSPTEDNARLGLEKQAEAMDTALDHPQQLTKSLQNEEPLELLHKDNLDAANEGPQFPSMQEGMQSQFKQTLLDKAIEEHPLMQKQQERIAKQEALIVKLSEQVDKGKAQPAALARAMKDLENFELAAERTKNNLTENLPVGKPGVPFNFKKQGGGILFEETPRAKDVLNKLRDGIRLNVKEEAFIRALNKEDNLGFDTPQQAIRALIEDPHPDYQISPELKRAATNMSVSKAELNLRDVLRQDARTHLGRMFTPQRGAINPEVFKEGFEKLKQLADGTWLRAHANGEQLKVDVIKNSRVLGGATFDAVDPNFVPATPSGSDFSRLSASSNETYIHGLEKRKGYATEVYKFVAELGNDIRPDATQTPDGVAMWEGFHKKGLARAGVIKSPGNKQRGAIQIDPKDADKGKFLSENAAIKLPTIVPSKLTPEKVIEIGKDQKDVDQNALQKIANYGTKGGEYQALKTDNVVIKFGFEKLGEADRLGRGDIQEFVHDKLGPASRALSNREKAEVWLIVNEADRLKKSPDLDSLAKNGFNEAQLYYITTHREVMDRAFDSINQARKSAGLEPIERRVAYATMKATGDYRRLVYKADDVGQKNVVGIVGADTRWLLETRMDALIEKGYTNFGKEDYYGGVPRERGSAQQAMQRVVEVLAEKDPRIAEFLDVVDEINKNEAYSFLNAKKHTLAKKGIMGMEGRKLFATAEANAREGMQAQLTFAESALKWGRLSEAVEAIRPVLASEELNMPKAKEWLEGYVKNALGYNPSELGHNLEMAFAKGMRPTGIGYSNIRGGVAIARKVVNTMLLGLDPGFWLTNVVQPMRAMPGMKAYLVAKGLDANFDFGTGYSYMAKAGATEWRASIGRPLTAIEAQAYNYAKTHHVYGSEMVEHSNRASRDFGYYADKVGGAVAGSIESGTRRIMFLSFVHMLHENGLSVKNGLFEAAHNITDMTMNNYSPVERPRMYNSMGPLGDMAVNLSSYKHNELSRLSLFARQVAEEKSAKPLVTELAAGVAFAGLTGIVAFQEIDWAYKQITTMAGHPDSLALRAIKLSEQVGKLAGNSDKQFNKSDYLLSHGGFSMLGIDMAKRLGLDNIVPDNAVDAAFPGVSKLGSMAKSSYQAVAPDFMPGSNGGPSEVNAMRALHELGPRPMASNIDLEYFSKGNLGNNKDTLRGQVHRTEGDVMAKRFGIQGIHESVEKSKTYETNTIKGKYAEMRVGPLHKARDEMYSDGKVSNSTIQAYVNADGDVGSLTADLVRFAKEQNMSAKDRDMLAATMSKSIANYRHLQRMKSAYENK